MFCRAGLANGAINMVAGMVIVAATVLLGVVEQISGMYAIRSPRGVVVVVSPPHKPTHAHAPDPTLDEAALAPLVVRRSSDLARLFE